MTSTIGRFQGRLASLIVFTAIVATACASGQVAPSPSPVSPSVAPATAPPPPPSTTPSPPATATPPPALPIGDLKAGATYSIDLGTERISLTVPGVGWFTIDNWFLGKDVMAPSDLYDMTLLPYVVGNVYPDPCRWDGNPLVPAVGPTVDDLANALVAQEGPGAMPAAAVTVGGHPGKRVELTIPDGVDTKTCDEGDFGRWQPHGFPDGYGPFTYGNGQHDTVYIVEVRGTRWVIDTNYLPGTSPANVAELKALVTSIRFDN